MMKGSAKEERGGVFNLKKGPSAHLSQSSLYSDEVHHSPYLRLFLHTLSPLDRDTEEIGRTGVLKKREIMGDKTFLSNISQRRWQATPVRGEKTFYAIWSLTDDAGIQRFVHSQTLMTRQQLMDKQKS